MSTEGRYRGLSQLTYPASARSALCGLQHREAKPAAAGLDADSHGGDTAGMGRATVHIVEDCAEVRGSLAELASSMGLRPIEYSSAGEFLARFRGGETGPACLILDMGSPRANHFNLQESLCAAGVRIPTIILYDDADAATAVEIMKQGAVDFVQKPFSPLAMASAIQQSIDDAAKRYRYDSLREAASRRIAMLSPREREAFDLLVRCFTTKQISQRFNIGEKTVDKHRVRVLEKLRVKSVAELVRLCLILDLVPVPSTTESCADL